MALQVLVPDTIWHAQHPIRFGPLRISCRMTLVRLSDASLWVHSPIPLSNELQAEIDALGPVSAAVAPNLSHNLYFTDFLRAYPDAKAYVAPGMNEKYDELKGFQPISTQAWPEDFESLFIEGLPVLNETVWLHKATNTLILTDLLFCFGASDSALTGLVAKLLGVHERLAMSRTMKLLVKDKRRFRESVRKIEEWTVHRIVLSHDQIVSVDTERKLRDAFAWLG